MSLNFLTLFLLIVMVPYVLTAKTEEDDDDDDDDDDENLVKKTMMMMQQTILQRKLLLVLQYCESKYSNLQTRKESFGHSTCERIDASRQGNGRTSETTAKAARRSFTSTTTKTRLFGKSTQCHEGCQIERIIE
eukprot:scaffold26441_cov142-Cylindrotheca_fusiformis.AAC.3